MGEEKQWVRVPMTLEEALFVRVLLEKRAKTASILGVADPKRGHTEYVAHGYRKTAATAKLLMYRIDQAAGVP